MSRIKRLTVEGIVLCVVCVAYALLPAFLPQLIPSLGIAMTDGGVSLFYACAWTAVLFIVGGLVVCYAAGDINSVCDLPLFLYATAFCLIGKCRGYDTITFFTNCLTVVADTAGAFAAYYGFRMLYSFFLLTKPEKGVEPVRKTVYLPFACLLFKYLLVVTGIADLTEFSIEFAGNIVLWLFFGALLTLLRYFLKKIPKQSSFAMRLVFYSICVSFLPYLCYVVIQPFELNFSAFKLYWPAEAVYALIIVPVGFAVAAFELVCKSVDGYNPKTMTACSTALVAICVCILSPSVFENPQLLLLACPFIYQLLNIPLKKFLNPEMTAVERSLDSLERTVFRCSSEDRILVTAADWIISMLDPEFVAFYQKRDKEGNAGKYLYTWFRREADDKPVLEYMLNERLENRSLDEKRVVHRKKGFSVPMYQNHEQTGFILIGTKSEEESFSAPEMALLKPVTRILMESMMVLSLRKQADYVSEMQNQIVFSFADMIESRDGTTGQHIKRTSTIVSLLAKNLREHNMYADKLMPSDYDMIALAAPLHDIGKIKVPDSILSKPGKLTAEEFETIKTHPVEGEKIIRRTMSSIENERYLKLAREMALYHHEKWNGKGYPEGLAGEDIPVSARIMAIADVFDALCSSRSYKEAYSVSQAFNILEESRGSHFESCLVDAMEVIKPDLEKLYAGA